jgi:hypothetical protein
MKRSGVRTFIVLNFYLISVLIDIQKISKLLQVRMILVECTKRKPRFEAQLDCLE